jgi:DNA-binding NarL/FixJ family response regulator
VIRVLLADDQALVRAGFRALLERTPGVEVVGEAPDGDRAVALARELRPDVVLMDLRMPVLDGLEATRRIAADPDLDGVQVLVLTTFGEDEHLFAALRAGAAGFLLKDVDPAQLRDGLRTVAGGEALLSPADTKRLIAEFAHRGGTRALPVAGATGATGVTGATGAAGPPLPDLTPRERELVTLVAQGRSNAEIAQALSISSATVKTHINRAMAKLGARDRAQLVVIGYEHGLVGRPS